jgi:hypothetical protein
MIIDAKVTILVHEDGNGPFLCKRKEVWLCCAVLISVIGGKGLRAVMKSRIQ